MRLRNCAGGAVFLGDKVFLLQNDKGEWVLPKGVIREGESPSEVAIGRVGYEAGIKAKIVAPAGETCYEFFSISRRAPICNKIDWFIMESESEQFKVNAEEGFQSGGYFPMDRAANMVTYSQDRALVRLAYDKYLAFQKE